MLNGSSFLTLGLSFWEGVGCSTAGYALVAIFMIVRPSHARSCVLALALTSPIAQLNGRFGAVYHAAFPVACRSSFGIVGALFPVLIRCLSSVLWNGVNSVSGGQAIYVMLHAIFPSISRVNNTMPSSSALTSSGMIGFFLFVLATLVMVLIDPRRWRPLIHSKIVVFVISTAAMIAWSVTAAGGVGPVVSRPSVLTGSTKSWTILQQILLNAARCARGKE